MAEERKKHKDEETTPEPIKKGSINKITILIIAGISLVVLLILTVVISMVLLNKPEPKAAKEKEPETIIVPMRDYIVNLIDYGGRRYLKVKIDLEVETEEKIKKGGEGKEPEPPEEFIKKESMLRNYIINILSNNSFNDIKTIEGKNNLRKGIILKCNMVLKHNKVLNVYFNDFIIQ